MTWPHVTLLSWFCAACSLFTGIACGRAGGMRLNIGNRVDTAGLALHIFS
ncbi:hypothetical protein ACRRTK_018103 [Alexandromys fortis]